MRGLKRYLGKGGITIIDILLILIMMRWTSMSESSAHERALGSATPRTVTVQATPIADAIATALNTEKLRHEND